MKEAAYYISNPDGTVVCTLCPHRCKIDEAKCGRCRSRINRGGHLYSLAYARICAMHADPMEKKPLFHFLPGATCFSIASAGCNLSCLNCQNWSVSQVSPMEIPSQTLLPEDCVRLAKKYGCRAVAYTYTEPLTYLEYVRDCASACQEAGLKNVLVTAGYVNEAPLCDLLPFIDAVNIDLKSFSDEVYRKVSRVRLQPILDTLLAMRDAGVWIEITRLLIPGISDGEEDIRAMCHWLMEHGFADNPLHISRFFPRYKLQDIDATPLSALLSARRMAQEEGMRFVYIGNTSLTDAENTYCPKCGSLLVKREGYAVSSGSFSGICPACGADIAGVWTF